MLTRFLVAVLLVPAFARGASAEVLKQVGDLPLTSHEELPGDSRYQVALPRR